MSVYGTPVAVTVVNTLDPSGSFIINQYAAPQSPANFWIDGKGRVDTAFGVNIDPVYALDVFTTDPIAGRFSGRVIGVDAVNPDEFITKAQLDASVGLLFARTDASNATAAAMYFDSSTQAMHWDNVTSFRLSSDTFLQVNYTTSQPRILSNPSATQLVSPDGNKLLSVTDVANEWIVTDTAYISMSQDDLGGKVSTFNLTAGAYGVTGVSAALSSSIVHNDSTSRLEVVSNKKIVLDTDSVSGLATIMNGRFSLDEGINVAASNNLTLGYGGNAFTITGNTTVNAISTTDWQEGSVIQLHITGTPIMKHNTAGGGSTAPMRLSGASDFPVAYYTVLELQLKDGFWNEVGRSIIGGTGPGIMTANNALYLSDPTNVRWGGPLIEHTTITMSGYSVNFTGDGSVDMQMFDGSGPIGTFGVSKFSSALGYSPGGGETFIIRALTNAAQLRYEQTGNGNAGVSGIADGIPNPVSVLYAFDEIGTTNHTVTVRRDEIRFSGSISSTGTTNLYADALPSATTANILYYNSGTGQITYGPAGTFESPLTFQNALTRTGDIIEWGGTLLHDTIILTGGYNTLWTGANATASVTVQNTSTGEAISASSAGGGSTIFALNTSIGAGVSGTSLSGYGGTFQSNSNIALVSSGTLGGQFSAFNTVTLNDSIPVVKVIRSTGGSTPLTGAGGSIDFRVYTDAVSDQLSTQLISRWTNVVDATRTSQFEIWNVNSATTQQHLTVKGTGQLQLNMYGSGTFTGSATKLLAVTSAGNVIEVATSGGGVFEVPLTFDNGLTRTVNNVQLGGTLVAHTTIFNSGFGMTFAGNSASTVTLTASNSLAANAITGSNSSSGVGVQGSSSSGTGVFGSSSTGLGGFFSTNPASTSTVVSVVDVRRTTTGTAAAGLGGSIDFTLETSNTSAQLAAQLVAAWTDATTASRTSQFIITGVDATVNANLFTLSGNGSLKLNKYGIGTFTGTPAYVSAWDSSGNFIETTLAGLGAITAITADEGLTTSSSTNVRLFGTSGTPATITTDRYLTGGSNTLNMTFNSLAGVSAFKITSTSTAATGSNLQRLIEVSKSGTQVNAVDSSAVWVENLTTPGFGAYSYGIYTHARLVSGSGSAIAIRADTTSQLGVWATATIGTAILAQSATTNTNSYTIGAFNSGSAGVAIQGQSDNDTGVRGISLSGGAPGGSFSGNLGGGVYATTNDGIPGDFNLTFSAVGDSGLKTTIRVAKNNSGSVNDNHGQSWDLYLKSSTALQLSHQIVSRFTTVANATRTSQYEIWGVNSAATQQQFTIKGTGQHQFNRYGVGSFTAGTPVYNLVVDSSGNIIESLTPVGGGGGGGITADNGLTMSTSTNVQLGYTTNSGSPLLHNTYINTGTFELLIGGSNATETLNVSNSAGARAITANASGGVGLYASVANGIGVWANSTSGTGFLSQTTTGISFIGTMNNSTTSTVETILNLQRLTTGTPANGIGLKMLFEIETTTSNIESNSIISKWTDVTHTTRTSEFIITGVNSAVTADLFTLSGNGALKLNKYGVGTFTGTAAYNLAVDSSGNVIEVTAGGGGGGSGTVNSGAALKAAYYPSAGTTVDDWIGVEFNNTNLNTKIISQATTQVVLEIKGISSQSADLLRFSSSAATADYALMTNVGLMQFFQGLESYGGGERTTVRLGQNALSSIASGGLGNIAIGYNAGASVTTSDYNVTIGFESGMNNTAEMITAVGFFSARSNTTGTSNTAFGERALQSNTTGSSNTAIGSYSMQLANGSGNVGLGAFTLQNTGGSNNMAIGSNAMLGHTTGNENVSIGTDSMRQGTTRSQSIAIGDHAGYTNMGSGSIFIGYSAGYFETTANRLYIENSGSTSPLIYGEFDNDIVKINGTFQISTVNNDNTEDKVLVWNSTAKTVEYRDATSLPTSSLIGTGVADRVAIWNGTNSLTSDAEFTYASDVLTLGKTTGLSLQLGDLTGVVSSTPVLISMGGTVSDERPDTSTGVAKLKLRLFDSGGSSICAIGPTQVSSNRTMDYYLDNSSGTHSFWVDNACVSRAAKNFFMVSAGTSASSTTPPYLDMGLETSSVAGQNPRIRMNTNAMGFGVSAGQLDYIVNTGNSHVWYTGGSEKMRINSSGELLININDTGAYQLQVGGDSYFEGATSDGSTPISIWKANNGGNRMYLWSDGHLRLGTASNSGSEVIKIDDLRPIAVYNSNSAQYSVIGIQNDQVSTSRSLEMAYTGSSYAPAYLTSGPTGEQGVIYTSGNYPLVFGTNNTYRGQITGAGEFQFAQQIRLPEISTPSTPTSGHGLIYFKSDGHVYALNDSGIETDLQAGGGGGVSDGDKGDITVGSSGSVWTIDSGVVTASKLASTLNLVTNVITVEDDNFSIKNLAGTGSTYFDTSAVSGTNVVSIPNANGTMVLTTTANTFSAGSKQTVSADATNAGLRFAGVSADPSALSAGDMWYRTDTGKLMYRDGNASATRVILTEAMAQTITTKTIALGSNTITGSTSDFNTALTGDDFAFIGTANVFTADQTVRKTGAIPTIVQDRPEVLADGTTLADQTVTGFSSTSVARTYGRIRTIMEDDTDTTEDASMRFSVMQGGTVTDYIKINDAIGLDIDLMKPVNFNSQNATNLGTLNTHTIPGGTDTFVMLGATQTMTGEKTFNDSVFKLRNPGNTFSYTLRSSAITADRDITWPLLTGNDTVTTIAATQTLTNKRVTLRDGSTTSSATPTINTDNVDIYRLTAQTVDITSFTTNLSGTPTEGQLLIISVTGTASRAITWGSSFEASSIALPTTTSGTSMLTCEFRWNSVTSKWRIKAYY